jgi:hypothetical protein
MQRILPEKSLQNAREIFDALKALLHKPFGARKMRLACALQFNADVVR